MKNLVAILLVLTTELTTAGAPLDLNFENVNEAQYWRVINDEVMGGVSSSSIQSNDALMVFKGILSLERNGGFASVYRTEDRHLELTKSAIAIRIKGDGRTYQFRLRTLESFGVSYSASFITKKGEWLEHSFTSEDFKPVFRGRAVVGMPTIDFERVVRIGFLLADRKAGPFKLQVSHIKQE